jgi:hypothetical protein
MLSKIQGELEEEMFVSWCFLDDNYTVSDFGTTFIISVYSVMGT